jgi:hypothetical protein
MISHLTPCYNSTMKSENGLSLSLDEVYKAVDISDVLLIAFPHLTGRLLFDVRTRPDDGPVIRSVPPVRGPDERFAYLRRLRPGLPDPERYVFIQWPLGVESLVTNDVWRHIEDHCIAAGGDRSGEECATLLRGLYELDRQEDREAIRGKSFKTLWPPQESQ